MSTPAKTRALVVGVDHHERHPKWNLLGPVRDAACFVKWLREQGVPSENIDLFLSPTGDSVFSDVLPADVKHSPASIAAIRDYITDGLQKKKEEILIVFWGGHGVIETDGTRRLIGSDAKATDLPNLDLDDLLAYMRSAAFPRRTFSRQFWVVDACADYATYDSQRLAFASGTLPTRQPGPIKHQSIYLACCRGQRAANLTRDQTGLFSQEFRQLLPAQPNPWPFDAEALWQQLDQKFRALGGNQRPASMEFRGPGKIEVGRLGIAPIWEDPLRRPNTPQLSASENLAKHSRLIAALAAVPLLADEAHRSALHLHLHNEDGAPMIEEIATALACRYAPGRAEGGERLLKVLLQLDSQTPLPSALFEAMDASMPLGQLTWRRYYQLLPLLDGAKLPDADLIRRAWRSATSAIQNVPEDGSASVMLHAAVAELSQIVRPKSGENRLQRFFAALHDKLGEPIRQWCEAEWSPDYHTCAALSGANAVSVLQLCFHLATNPSDPREHYRLSGWYWSQGTSGTAEKLSDDSEPLTEEQLATKFGELIQRASKLHPLRNKLRIEAILPFSLLHLEPHTWGLECTDPVGYWNHCQVVMRSHDRLYNERFETVWQRLHAKWQTLSDEVQESSCLWNWDGSHLENLMPPDLADPVVAFAYSIEPLEPAKSRQALKKLIRSGFPLAFLQRRSAHAADQRQLIEKHLVGVSPLQWPANSAVLRIRHKLSFSMMWENPDHLPCDSRYYYSIPA